MRTLCDACESAAAIVFCAADEAALCHACDEKVHMCNKLASRHVRVGLASPSDVPCCDICENAPAFFYCETDGTSLCLQCDMIVHVGGKRTHGRYLLFRQRVEFPGDKPGNDENPDSQPVDPSETKRVKNLLPKMRTGEKQQNHRMSLVLTPEPDADGPVIMENNMIDLNMKPQKIYEQTSNNQVAILLSSQHNPVLANEVLEHQGISIFMSILEINLLFSTDHKALQSIVNCKSLIPCNELCGFR
ncbi:hypothetical protein RJT34_30512 [Clitoria ternatea]|uniref:B box-type domain-containing protein n=1 Tax=Clitoria ternatea TaxID=43366 RepID=A0AAN9I7F4_CLITE